MQSKKIAFFPADYDTAATIRFAFMGNYNPIALLAPDLDTMSGEDVSKLDGGSKTNISLYSDYKRKISEVSIVYLVDSNWVTDDNVYRKIYEYTINLGKEVVVSNGVRKRLNLYVGTADNKKSYQQNDMNKLMPINAPIISIFSIGDYSGQLQIEYMARQHFLNEGYRVTQICSHEHGNMFGCLSLPDFVYSTTIENVDKILMLNNFIHSRDIDDTPDVIIIGVPQPIMKYNNEVLNSFGILPFIVQSAFQSDVGIVSLYYHDEYTNDYLELISNLCKYRFGVSASFFGISNTIAFKSENLINELDYLYITSEFVAKNLNRDLVNDEFTVFASYDEEDSRQALKKIECFLQENPMVV